MILDKAKMAHDWYMKHSESPSFMDTEIKMAWQYADAMQAEEDKRVVKLPHVFFDTKQNEEWQPDWIQAPIWANWWCINNIGSALFYEEKPRVFNNGFFGSRCCHAPTFDYQGNWQDSLRKRP